MRRRGLISAQKYYLKQMTSSVSNGVICQFRWILIYWFMFEIRLSYAVVELFFTFSVFFSFKLPHKSVHVHIYKDRHACWYLHEWDLHTFRSMSLAYVSVIIVELDLCENSNCKSKLSIGWCNSPSIQLSYTYEISSPAVHWWRDDKIHRSISVLRLPRQSCDSLIQLKTCFMCCPYYVALRSEGYCLDGYQSQSV